MWKLGYLPMSNRRPCSLVILRTFIAFDVKFYLRSHPFPFVETLLSFVVGRTFYVLFPLRTRGRKRQVFGERVQTEYPNF